MHRCIFASQILSVSQLWGSKKKIVQNSKFWINIFRFLPIRETMPASVKPVRSQFKRISIKANSCVNIEDCSPILHQIKSDMFWLQIHDYCPILRFNILVMASRQISVLFPSIPFGKWQNNTKSQTNNKWFIHSNLCVIEIRLFGIMCHTSWCLLCTSFVCDARICLIYSRI